MISQQAFFLKLLLSVLLPPFCLSSTIRPSASLCFILSCALRLWPVCNFFQCALFKCKRDGVFCCGFHSLISVCMCVFPEGWGWVKGGVGVVQNKHLSSSAGLQHHHVVVIHFLILGCFSSLITTVYWAYCVYVLPFIHLDFLLVSFWVLYSFLIVPLCSSEFQLLTG